MDNWTTVYQMTAQFKALYMIIVLLADVTRCHFIWGQTMGLIVPQQFAALLLRLTDSMDAQNVPEFQPKYRKRYAKKRKIATLQPFGCSLVSRVY